MNAKLLRGKIKEAGLTQEELADIVGMSPNSFSRKINGMRQFKANEIESLCRALNISDPISIFLDGILENK